MRKTILLSCVFFLMMACQAIGEGYWPPSDVQIDPQYPTTVGIVSITLSGDWPDNGTPTESTISVSGNDIYFDVVSNHGPLTVMTPWQLTESAGTLSLGTYTVYAKLLDDPLVPQTYTQVAEFTVGNYYWPLSDVQIDPLDPTSADTVAITLSGIWPDSCVPDASSISVDGNDIYFGVFSSLSEICLTVLTPWQLTESAGPLATGTYNLYTALDRCSWTLTTEFTVAEASTYVFVPDQSTVVKTGGFAGIHETYDIEGWFDLALNSDANTAWFDEVYGAIYHDGTLLRTTLDLMLRMTDMISTSVSDTVIEFQSNSPPGGITGELTLTFEEDDSVHLTGTFAQPYPDGFQYDLDAVARKNIVIDEVSWIPGETPPQNGWQISPLDPNINDLIDFTCAIGNGEIYSNSCFAEQAMGGIPTITINPVSRNIELRFEPPAPEICTTEYDPVCGLEGSFGPLEAGQWDLWAYFPGQVQSRSFHVFIPGDLDGDDDVDLRDFAGFAARWLDTGCGICDGADLTGDGNVGADDMRIFANNWLWGK